MSYTLGSYNSYNNNVDQLCYCNVKAKLSTAHTSTNYGRRFLGCSNYRTVKGCKFFQWVDVPFEPQACHVIQRLLKQKLESQEKILQLEQLLKAMVIEYSKKSYALRFNPIIVATVIVVVVKLIERLF